MINKRILTTLLALAILLSCVGWTPARAQGTAPEEETIDNATQILDNEESPTYVDAEQFKKAGHVQRLHDEEELDNYVYLNADGSKSVYYMDQDVKFMDDGGTIREKDITLVRGEKGYGMHSNDVGLHIPDSAADGINITHKSRGVRLLPMGGSGKAAVTDNSIVYSNFFGRGIHLKYTPMLSGVKEDVIITKYTGVNSFSFLLETGGLYLYNTDGRYYLAESATAKAAFYLGEVLVYDAIGRPDMGTMAVETITPGQRYKLTISANEAFLSDPETLYPVTIDPTLTVSDNTHGAGAVQDAPVFSGKPSNSFGSYVYNTIGYHSESYGTAMTVVRLAGLLSDETYAALTASNILNATFYMKDGGSSSAVVNIHALSGNSTWTESNVTWNNRGVYSIATYATDTMGSGGWGEFDITNLVRSWKTGANNAQCGFAMVIGDSTKKIGALSSEYSNTDYRPYVVVTYGFDPFYSDWESAKYYRNTFSCTDYIDYSGFLSEVEIYEDDGLQLRANCYGYAFRFFYSLDSFTADMGTTTFGGNEYVNYKQQPGEFANKLALKIYDVGNTTVLATLNNRADLNSLYIDMYYRSVYSNTQLMHILQQLLTADAGTLGYTITEYTGTSIPDSVSTSGKRLIALVVNQNDYHFYMQHSDNTWSHKPGAGQPENTCISHEEILTNDTIQAHACEGIYSGAELKFFYITKNAVVDYGHSNGLMGTSASTVVTNLEKAGNSIITAKQLGLTPSTLESGNIDYVDDIDFLAFSTQTTGTYSFVTSTDINMPLTINLYSDSGELLYTMVTSTGDTSFTYLLDAYTEYFISIQSPEQQKHYYRRIYSISIYRG